MVGSTRHIAACDPDEAQAFLDHWLDHIRSSVERLGGQIVHYAGDGGIAIFGWPTAYEDHADRACIAAWDIQSHSQSTGPGGDPVNFRVGVHSGLVGLRMGGRNAIARFDVAGATVHVAAKLQQQAAPGEVRVSAGAAKLCRWPLDLAEVNDTAGIAERPVEVYTLKARPHDVDHNDVARRYQNPMVNRVDELATLRELLPRPGGKSSSVALLGEPGIGKSRFATAVMTDALTLTPDVRCCVFYGGVQRRVTAFAAARTLVSDLLAAGSLSSDQHIRDALADLDVDAGDRRKLEALFIGGKTPSRQRLSDNTETQIARALVNAFLAQALSRPTLLLIEDLQWIDPESRNFLKLLARTETPQPLCMVLTGRPEAASQAADIAESIIHLQPMSRTNMETLGRQLWSKDRSPAVFARAIARADGVPFVLEEFLRSADATNAISELPQTVESVIHARLQRLSPKIKSFAQTLSLLGEEVEIQLATAVLDVDVGELLNALFELDRFAFIHPLAGNSVRFRHQIIAEACANTIPRDQRREIHRAAIHAITRRYANLHGRYEQLAFHAEEAGDADAALGYLWEAAVEARRNAAASSLSLIYDRALKLIERLGEAAEEKYVDFGRMVFPSMLQLGEFDKVKSHMPRTMELAQRQGRASQVCSVKSQLGMIYWFEGRYEEGLQVTGEGLRTAHVLGSPALIFSNLIVMANILFGMGHVGRAIAAMDELNEMLTGELETARLGTPAVPKCAVLAFRSWFMNATGQYGEALEFASRALAIAAGEQDSYGEVLSRLTMGRNLLMLHRNREAAECLAITKEIVERNGYDAIMANLTGALATALARTGQSRQAVSLVEACMESGMHLRTGQIEVSFLHAGYAEALVREGKIERGFAALDHALAIARSIRNPWLTIECLGLRARLLAETGSDGSRVAQDLAEIRAICDQYGVVAWDVSRLVA